MWQIAITKREELFHLTIEEHFGMQSKFAFLLLISMLIVFHYEIHVLCVSFWKE